MRPISPGCVLSHYALENPTFTWSLRSLCLWLVPDGIPCVAGSGSSRQQWFHTRHCAPPRCSSGWRSAAIFPASAGNAWNFFDVTFKSTGSRGATTNEAHPGHYAEFQCCLSRYEASPTKPQGKIHHRSKKQLRLFFVRHRGNSVRDLHGR